MTKNKIFATIIIATLLTSIFTGCSNDKTPKPVGQTSISETTTETETPEEETTPDIPNAKEFDEIEWPSFGIVTKVPAPTWSNRGEILVDSELLHWSQIGYATVENFNAYVKECQEYGFTENYYNMSGYMYYGENADGEAIQLTYNQYDHYVAIQVTNNAAEWDKWWVEDAE